MTEADNDDDDEYESGGEEDEEASGSAFTDDDNDTSRPPMGIFQHNSDSDRGGNGRSFFAPVTEEQMNQSI